MGDDGSPPATESKPEESNLRNSESVDRSNLSLDVVFDILKNHRRRLVLKYLLEISETSTLSDLAEYIAALENDKTEQELNSSERKRVYVCLYQCHLPKMDDAGVIQFDSDRGTVVLSDDTTQFTQYLDFGGEVDERNWPKYYAALAAIGGLIFVSQRLIFPVDALSGVIMGVIIGLFVNLALEHAYERGLLAGRRLDFWDRGTTGAN